MGSRSRILPHLSAWSRQRSFGPGATVRAQRQHRAALAFGQGRRDSRRRATPWSVETIRLMSSFTDFGCIKRECRRVVFGVRGLRGRRSGLRNGLTRSGPLFVDAASRRQPFNDAGMGIRAPDRNQRGLSLSYRSMSRAFSAARAAAMNTSRLRVGNAPLSSARQTFGPGTAPRADARRSRFPGTSGSPEAAGTRTRTRRRHRPACGPSRSSSAGTARPGPGRGRGSS